MKGSRVSCIGGKQFFIVKYFSILFFFLVLYGVSDAQNNNPTIAACDGKQYLCVVADTMEACVEIVVDPAYNNLAFIDHFEIDWGDSTALTIVPGGLNPPPQTHFYDLTEFADSCIYQGFYIVILRTYHTLPSIEVTNSAFVLTLRNPPKANFYVDPYVACAGDPVRFIGNDDDAPCIDKALNFQSWLVQDGSAFYGNTATYYWDTVGVQTLRYCAGNVCDTVCRYTVIASVNSTQADAVVDSGATQIGNLHYRVCFQEPWSAIRLDGSVSQYENFYSWFGDGQQNWFWYPDPYPPDTSIARVIFLEPGTYTIKLKADNFCNEPDTVSVTVEVVEPPVLSLVPQRDTCVEFSYTPFPYQPAAVYRINGVQTDTFPVLLPVSSTPYHVEAELNHTCNYQLLRDTFIVQTARDVVILSPDTTKLTFCVNPDTLRLESNLPVFWKGAGLQITPNDTFFVQNTPGSYRFIAFRDYGVCRRADTLFVQIDKPVVLRLDSLPVECLLRNYTPSPFEPEAVYKINGITRDTFPVSLEAPQSPFHVVATVQNACTDTTVSTTLLVIYPEQVYILSPDTALCTETPSLPLWASDSTGFWSGEHLFKYQGQTWFNPVDTGIYQLIYTRGVGICLSRDTMNISVAPSDSIQAGADIYICETEPSVEITGFTPGGFFSGFSVSGSTIDLALIKRDSSYSYVYTNPSFPPGCRSDELSLVVRSLPESGFITDRDTACQGELVTITPNAVSGVGYETDWGTGIQNTLTASYSTPGTYMLHYAAYNVNPLTGLPLCTVRDSAVIEIPAPLPPGAVNFIAQPDGGCAPLSVQFVNLSAAQHNHYLWETGYGQSYYGYSPPPVVYPDGSADTVFHVRLSVPNGCGFYVSDQTIKVLPNPKADFALSVSEICSGAPLEASLLSTGYPLSNTFYTSTGDTLAATAGISSVLSLSASGEPDTVGIWLVSANTCSADTAYQEVIVHPAAVDALIGTPNTPRCTGSPVVLYSQSTNGAPVLWKFSDGNTFLLDTVSVVFNTPGIYTATLYTYGCGYDSMNLPIQVYPTPEVSLVTDPHVCAYEEIPFQVNTNAPVILLAYGDGTTSSQASSAHKYPIPGSYTATATVSTLPGCKATDTRLINVLELPDIQADAENEVCTGREAAFSGNSTPPPINCYWRFGDGNFQPGCVTTHTYTQAGQYPAIFSVFAPNGCIHADTLYITATRTPETEIEYQLPQTCVPVTATFGVVSPAATNFIWKDNGVFVSGQATFSRMLTDAGMHAITLIASNNGLCPDTGRIVLHLDEAIEAEIIADPVCDPEDGIDLRIPTDPTNIVTVFSPTYFQTGDFHESLDTGSYSITVLNQIGCRTDTIISLSAPEMAVVRAEPDYFEIRPGETVQFNATSNQQDASFIWKPDLFLSNPAIRNPVCTPEKSMVYYVYATNTTGCVMVDTVRLILKINRENEIFIPDAFTPNEDEVNDIFYVRSNSPSVVSLDYMKIFDKYNELVFEARGTDASSLILPEYPDFGWDGTFRGQKAEAGSYRYVIAVRYIDEQVVIFSGTLQLIR
jgi:gliding motility-associated-like protein